jgi:hypothetical protein
VFALNFCHIPAFRAVCVWPQTMRNIPLFSTTTSEKPNPFLQTRFLSRGIFGFFGGELLC